MTLLLSTLVFVSVLTIPALAASVSIVDDSFAPREISITTGERVTWMHNGEDEHTVTADNGSFNSGTLAPGYNFSHTFTTAGRFPYYCAFHGGPGGVGMSGVVVVSDPPPPAEPPPADPAPAEPAPAEPPPPPPPAPAAAPAQPPPEGATPPPNPSPSPSPAAEVSSPEPSPESSPSPTPSPTLEAASRDGRGGGAVAVVAILAILIAGGAGLWLYWIIRRGL